MKILLVLLLGCVGCTRTLESSVNTDVLPHDPNVINKLSLGASFKTQW
jgi:hypothetical protein